MAQIVRLKDINGNDISVLPTQLEEEALSTNIWSMDKLSSTASSISFSASTNITITGTTDGYKLRNAHFLRISNTAASAIDVTLVKGTNIGKLRCLSTVIHIPANSTCELSCYVTQESIDGTNYYVANVTEFNGMTLS